MIASTDGRSTESPELCAGDVLAEKYLLVEPIAVGGMGRVWTACNLSTGAEVAAKVLLPAHAATPEGLARFRREAQATAKLSHRGIVRIFDLIELDPARGSLVMVMELLRGHTLARHIEHAGPLSVNETLEIVFPLLSALSHAHGLGIVHRDLKPENVFLALEPDGQRMPKIVDFGISKQLRASPITLDGQIVGTLRYMSPEQTLGVGVDERSDIFSMGILLYECLSGTNPFITPFTEDIPAHKLMSVFDIEPRPLANVPPALWRVVRQALAKRQEDRFASAAELADALRRAVPVSAPEPDPRSSALPSPPVAEVARAAAAPRMSHRMGVAALLASIAVITFASAAQTAGSHGHRSHRHEQVAVSVQKHLGVASDYLRAELAQPVAPPELALATARAQTDHTKKKASFPPFAQQPSRDAGRTLLASRAAAGVMRDPGF